MEPVITQQLHDTLNETPEISEVHFTQDAHYHFRTFSSDDKKDKNVYTRLQLVPEKSAQGIATGKHLHVAIMGIDKKPDGRYLVAKTMTREDVLKVKPVGNGILEAAGLSKAELLAKLEVTEKELDAFLKTQRKGK